MKREIIEWINIIEDYARSSVFDDKTELWKNLMVLKFNPRFEWFNCARIAKSSENETEIYVNTKEGWEELFEMPLEFNTDFDFSNRRIVPLLYPEYDSWTRTVQFKIRETYFSKMFVNTPKIVMQSPVEKVLKKGRFLEIQKHMRPDWQQRFFERYLRTFDFYSVADEDLKGFYKNIVSVTFGENLEIKHEESKTLDLPEYCEVDPMIIYIHVHEIITSFHNYIAYFLEQWHAVQPKLKEIGLWIDRDDYGALERLNTLERGKER